MVRDWVRDLKIDDILWIASVIPIDWDVVLTAERSLDIKLFTLKDCDSSSVISLIFEITMFTEIVWVKVLKPE